MDKYWGTQQEVSGQQLLEASYVFTATPHHSPITPRGNLPAAEKQAQGSRWSCIVVSCIIVWWVVMITDLPGGSDSKASVYNAGDPGSIPGLGRSPGEGNCKPLQYYCLENPMDRGAWWATVHGVAKTRTQLSNSSSLNDNRNKVHSKLNALDSSWNQLPQPWSMKKLSFKKSKPGAQKFGGHHFKWLFKLSTLQIDCNECTRLAMNHELLVIFVSMFHLVYALCKDHKCTMGCIFCIGQEYLITLLWFWLTWEVFMLHIK